MSEASYRIGRFFEELLPATIEGQRAAFNQTHGSLAIIVEGAGSWTITFGDASSPAAIIDEADTEADCIAVWTAGTFAALLDASHTPLAAAELRPVAVVGEIKLLARLGALLITPAHKGGVGARLAAFAA